MAAARGHWVIRVAPRAWWVSGSLRNFFKYTIIDSYLHFDIQASLEFLGSKEWEHFPDQAVSLQWGGAQSLPVVGSVLGTTLVSAGL